MADREDQRRTWYCRQGSTTHSRSGTFMLSVLFSVPSLMGTDTHFTDRYDVIVAG